MKEVRLLAGGIGSGKAYIMSKMVQELKETGNSVYIVSFADPIKQFIKNTFGIDKNGFGYIINDDMTFGEFYSQFKLTFFPNVANFRANQSVINSSAKQIYETALNIINGQHPISDTKSNLKRAIRFLLQITGTEMAQSYQKEVWPEICTKRIKNVQNYTDYVIIDDWRFLFEFFNLFRNFQNSDILLSPYYINADDEIRAKRRGITVDELKKQSNHASEIESETVIKSFMQIYYPHNVIDNNGE
jgi:hypothetical protein